ncbi:MAG: endonuclease/exonuclease/phosphatase family protein [Chloroflexota bacterium]
MGTLIAAALGTWLGIQALRMTLAMIIWNVAEDNTAYAGQVAALVWVVGIGGAFLLRFAPVRRPALWLGVIFAVLVVGRQALPGENTSPAFAFAAWIVWLWWLPAFIREASGRLVEVATGVVLGVALQVAGQVALHGLDLHLIDGPASVLTAVALAAGFAVALANVGATSQPSRGGWGAFARGPYLFIELTFVANLGRLEQLTGVPPLASALACATGFVVALLALAFPVPRAGRLVLAALAVALLVPGARLGTVAIAAVVVIQAGLALGLATAFMSGPRRLDTRIHACAALGGLVLFVFLFVFYSYRDRTDWLWPLAAALVAAPGLLARVSLSRRTLRPAIAAAAAILGAMAIASIPPSGDRPAAQPGPDLMVLNYNVHQGLDYWSVPSAAAVADRIETANADIVALQEVNRGWDLSAGIDLFAYLRWRLPQYHAVYGPMDTVLYGNVILSRFPISDSGTGSFARTSSVLARGYVWATLAAPGGPLLVTSTHFTSYAGYDEERTAQADAYVAFWAKRPRSVLAGDYNSYPEDASIARLISAGLVDAPASVGLGKEPTYSSGDPHERIDYIFVSPDLRTVSARILDGTASDHRPVFVVLRPR